MAWKLDDLRERVDYADEHGDREAADYFDVKVSSIERYRRELKLYEQDEYVKPNVLILDIETAPMKAYVWGMHKQFLNRPQVLSDWFMLTWSAKWLDSDKVFSDKLTPREALDENDERLVLNLAKMMNDADYIIAHNGDRFDFPRINSRLAMNNLPPISSYVSIDTCKWARKRLDFSSNRLDDLCDMLGLDGKTSTSFELWKKCLAGSRTALAEMEKYNRNDVIILEAVFKRLRPYIKGLPNMFPSVTGRDQDMVCTQCGSVNIEVDTPYRTNANMYNTYRCLDCGCIAGRERASMIKNKNELTNVAR